MNQNVLTFSPKNFVIAHELVTKENYGLVFIVGLILLYKSDKLNDNVYIDFCVRSKRFSKTLEKCEN